MFLIKNLNRVALNRLNCEYEIWIKINANQKNKYAPYDIHKRGRAEGDLVRLQLQKKKSSTNTSLYSIIMSICMKSHNKCRYVYLFRLSISD